MSILVIIALMLWLFIKAIPALLIVLMVYALFELFNTPRKDGR